MLAIVCGLVAGVIGFLPYPLAGWFTRVNRSSEALNPVAAWLGGVLLSVVLLVAALFICKALAADKVLPFGLAEVGTLLVSIVVYTCVLVRKGR